MLWTLQCDDPQVHVAGYGGPPRLTYRDSESQEAAHDLEPITRGYAANTCILHC